MIENFRGKMFVMQCYTQNYSMVICLLDMMMQLKSPVKVCFFPYKIILNVLKKVIRRKKKSG